MEYVSYLLNELTRCQVGSPVGRGIIETRTPA